MKDLMIDLETLGTTPDSVVISIGAVMFDPNTKQLGESFYAVLDVKEQIEVGRAIDVNTLKWWMGQSDAAKMVFRENAEPVGEALGLFSVWVSSFGEDVRPWGNGACFDVSMIQNLMGHYGIKVPWTYNNVMDLRTFRRFTANNATIIRPIGTHHDALSDAINQANYVMKHAP